MAQIPRLTFPANYDPTDNVCLRVPRALIPALGALLAQWLWRASWADGDHEQGYQAALLLMERILQECDMSCECDELLLLDTAYWRTSLPNHGQLYSTNRTLRWQQPNGSGQDVVTSSHWWSVDLGSDYITSGEGWPALEYKHFGDLVYLRGRLDPQIPGQYVGALPASARPAYNVRQLVSLWRSGSGWQPALAALYTDGQLQILGMTPGDVVMIDIFYERA